MESPLKKIEIELSCDPGNPLLGISPKKTKTLIQKTYGISCPSRHYYSIVKAKIWNQPISSSVDEWIKKMWCIYTVE